MGWLLSLSIGEREAGWQTVALGEAERQRTCHVGYSRNVGPRRSVPNQKHQLLWVYDKMLALKMSLILLLVQEQKLIPQGKGL